MARYSWSDYAGTKEPFAVQMEKAAKGSPARYGFAEGIVTPLPSHQGIEIFEFGKSNGFYLICEAHSPEQAGFLFRKFLKEAVLSYIGNRQLEL
jgi:hypothetical protein